MFVGGDAHARTHVKVRGPSLEWGLSSYLYLETEDSSPSLGFCSSAFFSHPPAISMTLQSLVFKGWLLALYFWQAEHHIRKSVLLASVSYGNNARMHICDLGLRQRYFFSNVKLRGSKDTPCPRVTEGDLLFVNIAGRKWQLLRSVPLMSYPVSVWMAPTASTRVPKVNLFCKS